MEEPKIVKLTEDYLNLDLGGGFPIGTILNRSPNGTGQYIKDDANLGDFCVARFEEISKICEIIEE